MKRRLLVIGLLALTILACGPCASLSRTVATPPRPIAISTPAAQRFEEKVGELLKLPPGQPFTLRVTEGELNSFLLLKLSEIESPPVTDLAVWFDEGHIHITGKFINVLPMPVRLYVVASAQVADELVQLKVEQASAGSFPIPTSLLDALSQSINETIAESALEFRITEVKIEKGELTISGFKK